MRRLIEICDAADPKEKDDNEPLEFEGDKNDDVGTLDCGGGVDCLEQDSLGSDGMDGSRRIRNGEPESVVSGVERGEDPVAMGNGRVRGLESNGASCELLFLRECGAKNGDDWSKPFELMASGSEGQEPKLEGYLKGTSKPGGGTGRGGVSGGVVSVSGTWDGLALSFDLRRVLFRDNLRASSSGESGEMP